MKEIKDFTNSIWLLGVGESLLHHKDQVKKLDDHITIGFHKFFPYCLEYLNFTPTYWTWFDPNAAMPGLNYLLAQKNIPIDMTIIVPYSYTFPLGEVLKHTNLSKRKDFPPHAYEDYYVKLNALRDRGMKIYPLNTVSNFYLKMEYDRLLSSVTHDERFYQNKMICGTTQDAMSKPVESKLTYYMFPLIQYMKINNAFVLGFDGQGGRFYNLEQKVAAGHNLQYIPYWNEWFQEFDMRAYSVADPKYTNLGNCIEYMDIEHAVELTKFANIEDKNNQIKILENIFERKFNKNVYNCQ